MASSEDVGRALETLGRALKPQPNQCSAFINL
jgi:hypothetical protein